MLDRKIFFWLTPSSALIVASQVLPRPIHKTGSSLNRRKCLILLPYFHILKGGVVFETIYYILHIRHTMLSPNTDPLALPCTTQVKPPLMLESSGSSIQPTYWIAFHNSNQGNTSIICKLRAQLLPMNTVLVLTASIDFQHHFEFRQNYQNLSKLG